MEIRTAAMADLQAISALEAECFPAAEAASRESIRARLAAYPEHFWLLLDGKKLWETPVCFAENIAEQPEQRRQLPGWMEKIIRFFGRKTP